MINNNMETLEELVEALNEIEEEPKEYIIVNDVVQEIVAIGNTDKVFAFDDDHLGLEDDLSDEFLNSKLDNIDTEEHEEDNERLLMVANDVIFYYNKELTEDDKEDIIEDKKSRGESIDDLDID